MMFLMKLYPKKHFLLINLFKKTSPEHTLEYCLDDVFQSNKILDRLYNVYLFGKIIIH